jgi:hypothetical protein
MEISTKDLKSMIDGRMDLFKTFIVTSPLKFCFWEFIKTKNLIMIGVTKKVPFDPLLKIIETVGTKALKGLRVFNKALFA